MVAAQAADLVVAAGLVAARGEADGSDNWLIYLLFIVAGFLVGGAWAAWQARNRLWTVITAALAVVACGIALNWLIGEMT
ncbi:hypothetical protein ACFSSC_11560 [Corynebacterium mendelii]|uniref:Uncharacterized protein n=1 Tax=Corynebacterium mendelii TaxID=2765362 RepID=A0A939IXF2_9CORY|nr:hypothetical protein [Corynebacterium mendelii]MBN9643612.1 hypothetical protein [Corynebacterium mendelii]